MLKWMRMICQQCISILDIKGQIRTLSLRFSLPHTPSVLYAFSALIIHPLQLLIMNQTLLVSTISNPKLISMWNKDTHGWQSLARSWSVVPGWRPRMYRLVLLCWSPQLLLPLLLVVVLGLGGAICWVEDAYACCENRDKTRYNTVLLDQNSKGLSFIFLWNVLWLMWKELLCWSLVTQSCHTQSKTLKYQNYAVATWI